MNKIIEKVKNTNSGYSMGDKEIKVVCYANDPAII
jgi:hypothetical protein